MVSLVDHEFQQELCEFGLDSHKVADVDDDGKPRRTAIIGSGVLSLAWAMAQRGWIIGIGSLLIFSFVTLYTSSLLADCYRFPDPVTGKRNHTYMEAVKAHLVCALQIRACILLVLASSMDQQSNCFHKKGQGAACEYSYNPYMISMGIIEILLSQIPNLHKMSWISVIAAIMSFGYASIGMGLSFAKVVSGQGAKTTLAGVEVVVDPLTASAKVWTMFRAIGDMVFACTYAEILIEIQDTLKSSPPENKVMKKASKIAILTSTAFYTTCGCLGYAAMGNHAPGNMLTGFGFYEPFWLIDLANIFIVVHLLGAYQMLSQPVFGALETWASMVWPDSKFVTIEHSTRIGKYIDFRMNLQKLTWRTLYVVVVTVLAMAFPFFNDVLALLGAFGYWPMTVYFPVEMYIAQKKIQRRSVKWFVLQLLNLVCLLVAIAAACGAIQGLNHALQNTKPFKF